MASKERNALSELANELNRIKNILRLERFFNCSEEVDKAQRIIAELAKVPDCTFVGNPRVDKSADSVIACRAIAEEGANDGNG